MGWSGQWLFRHQYSSDGWRRLRQRRLLLRNQIALFVHPNDGMIEPLQPKPVVLSVNNDQGLQFQASEGMTVKSVIPAQIKVWEPAMWLRMPEAPIPDR